MEFILTVWLVIAVGIGVLATIVWGLMILIKKFYKKKSTPGYVSDVGHIDIVPMETVKETKTSSKPQIVTPAQEEEIFSNEKSYGDL